MKERADQRSPDVDLGSEATTRLLRLATTERSRTVERLVERLESPDGEAWFERAIADSGLGSPADARRRLVDGAAGPADLRRLKEAGKARYAGGGDDPLAGALLYYLCQASAFVHHDVAVGSHSRAALRESFLDLASALPPGAWSALLERASTEPS